MQVDQKKVLNYLFLNLDPMRKIFNVTALILYVGLTFAYLTMVQMITAQVELPTNTNVTLLNETLTNNTNNTVSNVTNDTEMVENANPGHQYQIAFNMGRMNKGENYGRM